MTPKKRGGPQAIVSRKLRTEESVTLGKFAKWTIRERWVLALACGCKKPVRGASCGPKAKTACPNGHPTGFVAGVGGGA